MNTDDSGEEGRKGWMDEVLSWKEGAEAKTMGGIRGLLAQGSTSQEKEKAAILSLQ